MSVQPSLSDPTEPGQRLPVPPSVLDSWRTKILLLVGAAIVIVATAVGASGYFLARDHVRDQIGERLQDMVSSRAALLQAHIGHIQREMALITSSTRLVELLVEMRQEGRDAALTAETRIILEDARSSVDLIHS